MHLTAASVARLEPATSNGIPGRLASGVYTAGIAVEPLRCSASSTAAYTPNAQVVIKDRMGDPGGFLKFQSQCLGPLFAIENM